MAKHGKSVAIGMDLGGTKIGAGLVDSKGRTLIYHRVRSLSDDVQTPDDLVYKLALLAVSLKTEADKNGLKLAGVGLASAGPVDVENGELVAPTNMKKFKKVLLCHMLQKKMRAGGVKVPLYFQNDAIAAALGEHTFGAAKKAKVSVMITVGTGIGSGVLWKGQPLQNRGIGSEWGLNLWGDGSIESHSAGPALMARAKKCTGHSVQRLSDLPTALRRTPKFQKMVLQPTEETLAAFCANLSLGLAPDIISFSGGVFESESGLLKNIRKFYKLRMKPYSQFECPLHQTNLEHVGMLGAAALVFKEISKYR
jgi:glucokinase